jgi:hypothetical protein
MNNKNTKPPKGGVVLFILEAVLATHLLATTTLHAFTLVF